MARLLLIVAFVTLAACDDPNREPLNPTEVALAFDAEALDQLRGHILTRRHEWGRGPWMGDTTVSQHPAVLGGLEALGGRLYSINGKWSEDDRDFGYVEFAGVGGVGYKVSAVVWAYDCGAFAESWRRWDTRPELSDIGDPQETYDRLGGWLQYHGNHYVGM